MIFICLTSAFVIESSKHLVRNTPHLAFLFLTTNTACIHILCVGPSIITGSPPDDEPPTPLLMIPVMPMLFLQVTNNLIKLDNLMANSTQASVEGALNDGETWDTIRGNTQLKLREDDTVWHATVIVGYVTAFLYAILFFWFLMYEFSTVCGCCGDEEDEKHDNGALPL